MDDRTAQFEQQRPALFGLAYRLLGQVAEAEDIVQEAYLRWTSETAAAPVDSPKAYLTTIVTRLSLDVLKSARARREQYFGAWLPEPLLTTAPPDSLIAAESLSYAFLVLLESLSSTERAVFLLREVFDFDYAAIAAMLDTSEANCRQLLTRARQRIEARKPRFPASPEQQKELLGAFLQACRTGQLDPFARLLRTDATLTADSGGKARAPVNVLQGWTNIARFFLGIADKTPAGMQVSIEIINGQPGLVGRVDGQPVSILQISVWEGRIQDFYMIANPDKLRLTPAPPVR